MIKILRLQNFLKICKFLAQNGEKISEDRFGRHIYRKFGIRLYLSRPDRWNEYYKKEQSKKRSINDSSSGNKFLFNFVIFTNLLFCRIQEVKEELN